MIPDDQLKAFVAFWVKYRWFEETKRWGVDLSKLITDPGAVWPRNESGSNDNKEGYF